MKRSYTALTTVSTRTDATSLEREVAALRMEVADLEAELASYTAVDRKTLAKGLAGGVLTVLVLAAGAAAVVALMAAVGAWFADCGSQGGPHHGPVTGP